MGLKYFVAYYGRMMGTKMQAQMRRELFEHLETLPYSYYDNHETGKIVSRMTNDFKNPKLLILDEATSVLDNTTEILIQSELDQLCKGRTTLIVVHRLSTIKNATRICVITNGHIVEDGSHDELIEKNGLYKKSYDAQFKTSEDELIGTNEFA